MIASQTHFTLIEGLALLYTSMSVCFGVSLAFCIPPLRKAGLW